MNPKEEILQHFSQSFEDGWFSRSERKTLRGLIKTHAFDERELGVIRSKVFDLAREKAKDWSTDEIINWLEEANKTLLAPPEKSSSLRIYTSPGPKCREAILSQLRAAKKRIDICVFTISDNYLSDAILERHQRGVKVRVLTDNEKSEDRGSDIQMLANKGVPVRMDVSDHHMHHKFAIFDRHTLLSGSYNWTRSAAEYNWENLFFSDDKKAVIELERTFEDLWERMVDY